MSVSNGTDAWYPRTSVTLRNYCLEATLSILLWVNEDGLVEEYLRYQYMDGRLRQAGEYTLNYDVEGRLNDVAKSVVRLTLWQTLTHLQAFLINQQWSLI